MKIYIDAKIVKNTIVKASRAWTKEICEISVSNDYNSTFMFVANLDGEIIDAYHNFEVIDIHEDWKKFKFGFIILQDVAKSFNYKEYEICAENELTKDLLLKYSSIEETLIDNFKIDGKKSISIDDQIFLAFMGK